MALETGRERRSADLAQNPISARLPATISSGVPAERPGTAGFPPPGLMDLGLPESGWWWAQSGANPSLAKYPVMPC